MTGHLIHIGYPKTGSTFLQRWFEVHPQLAFADGGIAGYRDVYSIVRDGATAPGPEVLYRVTSSEGLSAPLPSAGKDVVDYGGEQPPMKDAQAQVCATLAELFPTARVLVVTRGFRSMILSSYSQYVRSGGDVALADLIAGSLQGATSGRLRARDPFDYDHVLGIYARAFGAENVIALPYELLRDDADAFLRALEARLGLTHCAAAPDRVNTSLSPVEMYWYPRLTRAVRRLPLVRKRYLHATFANRLRFPIAVLQRFRPGRPVTADTIPDEIVEGYRGKAESLRGNALYGAYARDYLHE
jgi:hypothetical protein